MYYAEKMIDGILHYKYSPTAEWTRYTLEQLSAMDESKKKDIQIWQDKYKIAVKANTNTGIALDRVRDHNDVLHEKIIFHEEYVRGVNTTNDDLRREINKLEYLLKVKTKELVEAQQDIIEDDIDIDALTAENKKLTKDLSVARVELHKIDEAVKVLHKLALTSFGQQSPVMIMVGVTEE